LDKDEFLEDAKSLVDFLESTCYEPGSGKLYHTYTDGKTGTSSFLEDYAFTIDALISLYEASGENKHIELARELCHAAIDRFYDDRSGLFNFTDNREEKLVSTPIELSDNVIPATNSVMTGNLFKLSSIFGITHFEKVAERLLNGVEKGIIEYSEGYFNWMKNWLTRCIGSPEVVITGPDARRISHSLKGETFPLSLQIFSLKPSRLEIFRGRIKSDQNQIHLCKNHSCQLPQSELSKALKDIKRLIEETREEIA